MFLWSAKDILSAQPPHREYYHIYSFIHYVQNFHIKGVHCNSDLRKLLSSVHLNKERKNDNKIIMKHFFRVQFLEKRGLKVLHNVYTHTHTHKHAHTPQFSQSTGGGGNSSNTNIKYMYNDENNTGKRKLITNEL